MKHKIKALERVLFFCCRLANIFMPFWCLHSIMRRCLQYRNVRRKTKDLYLQHGVWHDNGTSILQHYWLELFPFERKIYGGEYERRVGNKRVRLCAWRVLLERHEKHIAHVEQSPYILRVCAERVV